MGGALLVAPLGVAAAAQTPGRLVERMTAQRAPSQSYALYVPSQYTPGRAWPVIFVFDPAARGTVAAQAFQQAAERHAYIVVASNNSHNGPIKPSIEAFAAMLADVQKRFSIDPGRLYAAGFSGGARVAGLAGFTCHQCIRAVIACGAGLPEGLNERGRALLPPYFFSVGKYDFNYFDTLDAARSLPRGHRVKIFDGGHQWPPAEVMDEALAWLDAGAPMETNSAPTSTEEDRQRKRQGELTQELLRLLSAIRQGGPTEEQSVADARAVVVSLRSKLERATTDADITVLRRSIGQAFVLPYEMAQAALRDNEPARAGSLFEIAEAASPSSPETSYQAATAYAVVGDKKKAFAALRRAIKGGFSDQLRLESDPSFERWRGSAEFREMVRLAGGA